MPNPHAEWRTDYARRLSMRLLAFEGIEAIVVAGSVARNHADEHSDLELPIFWKTVPDDQVRASIAEALQAGFLFEYDGPSREDQLLVGGVQVDLWHIAVAHQEDSMQAVLRQHRTDLAASTHWTPSAAASRSMGTNWFGAGNPRRRSSRPAWLWPSCASISPRSAWTSSPRTRAGGIPPASTPSYVIFSTRPSWFCSPSTAATSQPSSGCIQLWWPWR